MEYSSSVSVNSVNILLNSGMNHFKNSKATLTDLVLLNLVPLNSTVVNYILIKYR